MLEPVARLRRARNKTFLFDDVEDGQPDRGRKRIGHMGRIEQESGLCASSSIIESPRFQKSGSAALRSKGFKSSE
jgi:hypothetical protein